MNEIKPKIALDLIEPFRKIKPYSKIKSKDLQTVSILLALMNNPFILDAMIEASQQE